MCRKANSTYTLVKVCVFYECVCVCYLLVYSKPTLMIRIRVGGELSEGTREKYTSVIHPESDVIQFPL